jgi:Ni,Fe-hydrogenase I small subunit
MQLKNLVQLQRQGCSGDTISLIGAGRPLLVDVLTWVLPEADDFRLAFHPTVMVSWGEKALSILDDAREGKLGPFLQDYY